MILRKNKGISLVEIVVIMALMLLIFFIGSRSFVSVRNKFMLDGEVTKIEDILKEARADALSSGNNYGVRFDDGDVILFKGMVFSDDPGNKEITLDSAVRITYVDLANSDIDVVFDRLSGEARNPGSVVISLVSDPTRFRRINIYPIGTVYTE